MSSPSFVSRYYGRLVAVAALGALGALVAARQLRGPLVPVAAATRADLRQTVVASGRVLAPARIKLGSLVLARVQQVLVAEGQQVKTGALLVQLDDAEARAALAQARAEVARARARLLSLQRRSRELSQQAVQRAQLAVDEASKELARQRKLIGQGASTRVALERAERADQRTRSQLQTALTEALDTRRGGGAYLVAVAGLNAAQAAAQRDEARLQQTRISAPCDGVVIARHAEPGDVVPAGQTLLELAAAGEPRILIEPDERNLALLAVGQQGRASADAHPQEHFAVRVETIVPVVDRATGTFRVKLSVDRPPRYLVDDMTVSAEIVVARRTAVLTVPRSAVRALSTEQPWALVLQGERAIRRRLRIGVRGARRVEVLAGLQDGEQTILATERPLAVGDRVRPQPAGDGEER